jgi:hypothetical protein
MEIDYKLLIFYPLYFLVSISLYTERFSVQSFIRRSEVYIFQFLKSLRKNTLTENIIILIPLSFCSILMFKLDYHKIETITLKYLIVFSIISITKPQKITNQFISNELMYISLICLMYLSSTDVIIYTTILALIINSLLLSENLIKKNITLLDRVRGSFVVFVFITNLIMKSDIEVIQNIYYIMPALCITLFMIKKIAMMFKMVNFKNKQVISILLCISYGVIYGIT